ncbi:MAG: RHS repeat domain-containing protein [Nitrospiraceae bacterium]
MSFGALDKPSRAKHRKSDTDHLNTPRLVADAAGTTVWRWDQQEPFGNNPADEDPDANSVAFDLPLRLPGQRYDKETGLHYNYFRDYDPSVGSYGQPDLVGLVTTPSPLPGVPLNHAYAYVDARPLDRTDPEGLFGIPGAIGGAGVSIAIQVGICIKKGGSYPMCLKCIDWVNVGVSAAMGAIFPTWSGNVLGPAILGRAAVGTTATNAKGAAGGTFAGTVLKVIYPSKQIACDDECAPYRFDPWRTGFFTSLF